MSGHTPGPWETGKCYGMHGVEVVGDNGNRIVCGVIGVEKDTHDPDGRKTGTAPTADGWANARLIAAAPELLKALQAAMAFIESHVADPDITQEMCVRYAELEAASPRDAIAKATGAA